MYRLHRGKLYAFGFSPFGLRRYKQLSIKIFSVSLFLLLGMHFLSKLLLQYSFHFTKIATISFPFAFILFKCQHWSYRP